MNVVAGLQGWTSPRSMLWPSAARAVVAMTAIALLLVNCCLADEPPAAAQADPMLVDGDRIVLLGEGFVEREGQFGLIEAALTAGHPQATLAFRNLGWNGDTVWAESRGVFDSPAEGYRRMLELVGDLQPTVVFVAYGRNESYAGPEGVAAFREQLTRLCADLTRPAPAAANDDQAPPPARLVLVTPVPFLPAATCPDADRRNELLATYAAVIRDVATSTDSGLIDLFSTFPRANDGGRLSLDGIQLTEAGYREAAAIMLAATGGSLTSDDLGRLEPIRELVAAKNELFFHRWRPTNETYLFLFRRHEQGNNAVEIPQFDPLVAAAEGRIRAAVEALP
jgi:hypothetical protein